MVASPSALRRCHTCLQSCPREAFTRSQIRKRGKRARCKSCTSSSNRPTIQGKSAIPASSTDRDANSRLPRSDVYLRESRSNAAGEKSPVSEVSTIEGNAVKAPGSDEKRLEVKMTGLVNPAKKPESRVPSPTSVAEHPSVVSCGSPGESAAVSSEEMEYYGRKCTGLLFKLYREEKDSDEAARAAAIKFMAEHEGREKDLWEKLVQHEEKMKTERQSLTPLLTKKQNDCNDNVSHTRSEEKPTIRGKIGMKRKRVEVATDLNCDRCDGAHESTKCPYYKKPRGNHPDEQRRRKGQGLASAGGNYFIPFHRARVRHQPGDGSCLYHSMCFGLRRRCRSAHSLRKELGTFKTVTFEMYAHIEVAE